MTSTVDTSVLQSLGLTPKPKAATTAPADPTGQDTFMKLILAQLQNQDPTKPMDNSQFLSQLAQFQSVSGINNLNTTVSALSSSLQSSQALQASSLVGRAVMVQSNTSQLSAQSGMYGSVEVPSTASDVMVSIKDGTGQVIKQIDLGAQQQGTVDFSWDGKDSNGIAYPPGNYAIAATASINGVRQSLVTNTIAPVDSVIMGKAGTGMTVNATGIGPVKLSDIKQIL